MHLTAAASVRVLVIDLLIVVGCNAVVGRHLRNLFTKYRWILNGKAQARVVNSGHEKIIGIRTFHALSQYLKHYEIGWKLKIRYLKIRKSRKANNARGRSRVMSQRKWFTRGGKLACKWDEETTISILQTKTIKVVFWRSSERENR